MQVFHPSVRLQLIIIKPCAYVMDTINTHRKYFSGFKFGCFDILFASL